jgi:hypothetical protein
MRSATKALHGRCFEIKVAVSKSSESSCWRESETRKCSYSKGAYEEAQIMFDAAVIFLIKFFNNK